MYERNAEDFLCVSATTKKTNYNFKYSEHWLALEFSNTKQIRGNMVGFGMPLLILYAVHVNFVSNTTLYTIFYAILLISSVYWFNNFSHSVLFMAQAWNWFLFRPIIRHAEKKMSAPLLDQLVMRQKISTIFEGREWKCWKTAQSTPSKVTLDFCAVQILLLFGVSRKSQLIANFHRSTARNIVRFYHCCGTGNQTIFYVGY